MKILFLIDANSIIHRCFHALPKFTTPDGRPSGALYGLSSILLKIFRENKPDYAAALFDRPEPTFRDEIYKEYKATRPPTADALIPQIIEAPKLFEKFGVKPFDKAGFEADDLIATFAEKFSHEPDLKVVILTGDMDTLQLVHDDKIMVRAFKKGISETVDYDEKAVEEKYGLKPNQIIDYKALVGDVSDNVKGVPGVGPKTAADILQKFGTIENVYKNAGSLPEKVRAKLLEYEKQAEISEKLVTLEKNVPVGRVELEELSADMNREKLENYFSEMGFKSLLKRLENGGNAGRDENHAPQGKIF